MKTLKSTNKDNPRERMELINSFTEKIKSDQDSGNEEKQVLEFLEKSTKPVDIAVAIEIAAKGKLVESVPALYDLLRSPVANTLNPKWMDPPEALIEIGKDGLRPLLQSIKDDSPENIPYQIIANVLYHWFGKNKDELLEFLSRQQDEADVRNKSKFRGLIDAINNWKSE